LNLVVLHDLNAVAEGVAEVERAAGRQLHVRLVALHGREPDDDGPQAHLARDGRVHATALLVAFLSLTVI